jgi:hypothetical protein
MSNNFDGVGGSYVVDAKGKRTLVERTFDPNQEAAGQPLPENPESVPANDPDQEEA